MNISKDRSKELTGFQESAKYDPSIDLGTDFAMVYGVSEDIAERIEAWRSRGYVVHLMTGISWGNYQDFLYKGTFDGQTHEDLGQVDQHGIGVNHGHSVPYVVPSTEFSDYLTQKLKPAVDSGVVAIHLEEPEFWVRSGYSEGFKREWEIHYKEPWIAPNSSPDAQYRASKLKSYLLTRSLDRVCSSLKSYAKIKYNRDVRFYVPTHSLINYSSWNIVSPESKLIDLHSIDGYIAQIWTGPARTPNTYNGVYRERTFETGYLEYGIMQELTRGTGRDMWFLHDPIEDNGAHEWEEYEYHYYKTVVASLFHPDVYHYEIVPWPNRVYNGKYPRESEEARSIPADYAVDLNIIGNALRDMEQTDVAFDNNNSVVGVLIADSSMFQRVDFSKNQKENIQYETMDVFYGMCLPLLKYGLPIRPVQLDNVRRFSSYLDDYKMLILSYEFMKPEFPDLHNALAQWVRGGGILVYAGDGKDPYNDVNEWWNQGRKQYDQPAQHLFESLNIDVDDFRAKMPKDKPKASKMVNGTGRIQGFLLDESNGSKCVVFFVGDGLFVYIDESPAEFAQDPAKANCYRKRIKKIMKSKVDIELKWEPSNHFVLRRGPYVVCDVMDESINDDPCMLEGKFVDLFDAELPVKNTVAIKPDGNALLYDIDKAPDVPGMELYPLAGSARVEVPTDEEVVESGYVGEYFSTFTAKGPKGVDAFIRFIYKRKPSSCFLWDGSEATECPIEFNDETKTLLINFPNRAEGYYVFFN